MIYTGLKLSLAHFDQLQFSFRGGWNLSPLPATYSSHIVNGLDYSIRLTDLQGKMSGFLMVHARMSM